MASQRIRFIPTHVGLTASVAALASIAAVHPHARGAYHNTRCASCMNGGSSPRTWGLRVRARVRAHERRFIPTHVGLTDKSESTSADKTVHPHARGAYTFSDKSSFPPSGSSPRTWGLLTYILAFIIYQRFIPTHVGLTVAMRNPPWRCVWFIPTHVGLTNVHVDVNMEVRGSSPRTWGLLVILCKYI